jgi:hypothetical protein
MLFSGGGVRAMEKAVMVGKVDDLETAQDYDRLYFGVEFCEIKIPSVDEVSQALAFARSKNMAFTLITPYVTDRGLAAVERAFKALPDREEAEVVVNDYGVFRILRAERPDLKPVLGRLLVKQKRGFGISAHRQDAGPALAEHWRASAVDYPVVRTYIENLGVDRVELDNLPQGISSEFSGSGLAASIYTPYGYLTTTRYCPWVFNGVTWFNLSGRCGRPCLKGMIEETGDVFDRTVFLSGNAQFYKNETLPAEKELLDKGIDRIVYEENIPV